VPNNPMGAIGHQTDIETGNPLVLERELSKKRMLLNKIEKSQSLINELTGDKGLIIQEVLALYVDRVNQLIKEDTECQAYEKILATIKYDIKIGKKIVERKMEGLIDF
jgi:hypothetical protein